MAVEQIRPVEGQRKAAQRKTPELNVDTAITILFGTSRLEGDSFISTLRYARNEGMLEVDETYVKVKGRWTYLYRAVDSRGQTIDFLLSARRDAEAAKRFFRKALAQPHTVNPRSITVDKNAAYPKATTDMKRDGELWWRSKLRQVKYLNNIVEQDHRNVKRLIDPGLGFGGFWTARRTLAGYEAMAMIRKGQVRKIGGSDIRAQARFIVGLFEAAA